MAKVARRHHYVPQFYLAAFSDSGRKDGRLSVLDQRKLKQWPSTPSNCAFERDLYDVADSIPRNPGAVERVFSTLETRFATVVRSVIEKRVLPTGEDLNALMNFVALTAVRVPAVRRQVEALSDAFLKHELRQRIARPEGWEPFRGAIDAANSSATKVTEQEFRQFLDGNDYTIGLGQTEYIQMMVAGVDAILDTLVHRYWTVLSVVDGASYDQKLWMVTSQ